MWASRAGAPAAEAPAAKARVGRGVVAEVLGRALERHQMVPEGAAEGLGQALGRQPSCRWIARTGRG